MIFSVIMLIKNHSRKKSHDTDVSQRKKRKRTFESLPESVYCATSKRKIIVPGGAAGLQIRLGPPAVPGRFNSCDLPPVCLCSPTATPYQPEPPKLIIPANHFHPNPALFCLSQTRYTGAVAVCRYQPKQESHNDPRTQTLFFHYHPG